jgi:hypothetical protein
MVLVKAVMMEPQMETFEAVLKVVMKDDVMVGKLGV